MGDKDTDDFVIFYAWQSNLPNRTNRHAIREAIRIASSRLEEMFASKRLRIVLDEATRGQSGSPNIPLTILEKIRNSHAFICDITTINSTGDNTDAKVPNPNVTFELGYAVSQLGWQRIIMLFNKGIGDFPEDVPFDFDRQRVSTYLISPSSEAELRTDATAQRKVISNLLTMAIKAVITANPTKPFGALDLTPEEQKRKRDIANIERILAAVHLPSIDFHIQEAPYRIEQRIFHFWESFDGVVKNSLFHLYDGRLKTSVTQIHHYWGESLAFGQHYQPAANNMVSIFRYSVDVGLSQEQQKDWDHIVDSLGELRRSLDSFLAYLRKEYMEIAVEELSSTAWQEYIEYYK